MWSDCPQYQEIPTGIRKQVTFGTEQGSSVNKNKKRKHLPIKRLDLYIEYDKAI
jgi:hypothetical protein